jgi:hypothetical protein
VTQYFISLPVCSENVSPKTVTFEHRSDEGKDTAMCLVREEHLGRGNRVLKATEEKHLCTRSIKRSMWHRGGSSRQSNARGCPLQVILWALLPNLSGVGATGPNKGDEDSSSSHSWD